MVKKIFIVFLICWALAGCYLILTAIMPTLITFTNFAANDTTTGNYTGYHEAAQAAPLWIYGIPTLVAGAAVFVTLRGGLHGNRAGN